VLFVGAMVIGIGTYTGLGCTIQSRAEARLNGLNFSTQTARSKPLDDDGTEARVCVGSAMQSQRGAIPIKSE
jgi:hypothetical protein